MITRTLKRERESTSYSAIKQKRKLKDLKDTGKKEKKGVIDCCFCNGIISYGNFNN